MYFHCPSLNAILPVVDCHTRRGSTKKGEVGRIDSADAVGVSFSMSICRKCVIHSEATAKDKLITHDQMMERLSQNPSQSASEHKSAYTRSPYSRGPYVPFEDMSRPINRHM